MGTEADTCRKFVLPMLYAAGWTDDQIDEQRTFTNGRIIVAGNTVSRGKQKRADYLLRYRPSLMIAVVEAKADYRNPGAGQSTTSARTWFASARTTLLESWPMRQKSAGAT